MQATPCLDVVAFSCDPPACSGAGFERFTRVFTKRDGAQYTFYRTGDMKRFRKVEQRTLEGPFHWFSEPSLLETKLLGFHTHSGDAPQNVCPPSIDLGLMGCWEPALFVFRVSLPVEAGEKPEELLALVQDALADFPLQSGYCGYSLLWNGADLSLERQLFKWTKPLLLRHPGLNHGDVDMAANAAHDGVVVVSWLTFLGKSIAADLGGRDALRHACPPEASLLPLDAGGCILRASAAPATGDVNFGDRLPAYRAVGKLVAPRRASDEALEDFVIEGLEEDQARDWKRRFFE